jgi:hypothetical protein
LAGRLVLWAFSPLKADNRVKRQRIRRAIWNKPNLKPGQLAPAAPKAPSGVAKDHPRAARRRVIMATLFRYL